MPVGPFSRYRDLAGFPVQHASRGATTSLPIRRDPAVVPAGARTHRLGAFEAPDLLALTYLGDEELYWYLLEANGGRLPDELRPGETLAVPPLSLVTRVTRPEP